MFSELKRLYIENKLILYALMFFNVLAYTYFITHWAISIDSETQAFIKTHSIIISWLSEGRVAIPLINMLDNQHILPFWNDFLSVTIIYLATLVWLLNLHKLDCANGNSLFIFGLLFSVSPTYSFFLRFTTYNVTISLAILFLSLSIYCYINFLKTKNKSDYFFSIALLLTSVCIYQVFINYFVSAAILVIFIRILNLSKRGANIKYIKDVVYAISILLISIIIYKFVCVIVFKFVAKSSYISNFSLWGKADLVTIISIWKQYFSYFIESRFNFLVLLSLLVSVVSGVYISTINKRIDTFLFMIIFVLSPFTFVFVLAHDMPYRTMLNMPFVIAGIWILIYISTSKRILHKLIVIFVVLCTFYNAQYINRLFYGDVMRYEYDKNFANRIYNSVLNKVGDSIESKPLVILGSLPPPSKPFILRSKYDTIGYSFFQFEGRQRERMFYFMSWLGNDYILPTTKQEKKVLSIAYSMPMYPSKGYIKETNKFIIVKLSNTYLNDPPSIKLDLDRYQSIKSSNIHFFLDKNVSEKGTILVAGWAYIKKTNAEDSNIFLQVVSKSGESKLYPTRIFIRPDLSDIFKDGSNLSQAGFLINLKKKKINCENQLYLLIINNKKYSSVKIKNPACIN